MNPKINRRDFLRLASLLPLGLASPRWTRKLSGPGGQPNVIVVVFDAFSAYHISLYGYERETTPNLARLSKRAIVYRNHFAGSSFTTPGTASLLTGTLPWTHRALRWNGTVAPSFSDRTIFDVFHDYYRVAYAHNPLAFTLLQQFQDQINELTQVEDLLLRSYDDFISKLFKHDSDISTVGWLRNAKLRDGYAYSLFFSHIDKLLEDRQRAQLQSEFPLGEAPTVGRQYYLLEEAVDWVAKTVHTLPQPFLGYFHFLPPHDPYRPPWGFSSRFAADGYRPLDKPVDTFADYTGQSLLKDCTHYDEFILYLDREFGRLYDRLQQMGLLENTWLVLTSDHGEMFERGIKGHNTAALYQPVIRIPLMIFEPGRREGMDVHAATSAVDVLPTLAHVTGHPAPPWTEGVLLPPFATGEPDPSRSLYVVRADHNDPGRALTNASTMLLRGRYKLVYYFGYEDKGIRDFTRLYNVEADPQELVDLSNVEKDMARSLLNELKSKLSEVNKPYL